MPVHAVSIILQIFAMPSATPATQSSSTLLLAERLERGELVLFERCPFPLPAGDDLEFLLTRTVSEAKSITYLRDNSVLHGHLAAQSGDDARLTGLLRDFQRNATEWLARTLPRYHATARL